MANPEWKMDRIPEIMDGKNIADFIDPDIAEKLEALEREEEKLQAEGFYESDSDIVRFFSPYLFILTTSKKTWHLFYKKKFDSDDEREAIQSRIALSHKIKSQSIKKSKKNQSRLPRTAGLRTLSELTTEMTKAGLDPSRIQERAEMLAKVQGAKRKRNADDDEDVEMDDDGDDNDVDDDASGTGMDVDDDDESSPAKRVKTNSGGVINKRAPRSNRQAAGMRDEGVSVISWLPLHLFLF